MSGIFAHSVPDMFGRSISLSGFAGRVTLMVNSASMCSFAPRNMEAIKHFQDHYSSAHPGRCQVLMFPSTDFAHQEMMLPEEIIDWARGEYGCALSGVSVKAGTTTSDSAAGGGNTACPILLFGRTHVKSMGVNWQAPPCYELAALSCGPPMWNWYKYVCAADGTPIQRLTNLDGWNVVQQQTDLVLKSYGK